MADEPYVNGLCEVEYAKSGRARCKSCQKGIGDGALRIAKKTQSRFYDGLETTWNHYSCVKNALSRLTQLSGWQRLKYGDQLKIRQSCGETVDIHSSEEIALREESERLFLMQSELKKKFNANDLKFIMLANSLPVVGAKPNINDLLHVVADSLINGLLESCPGCKNNTLTLRSGNIWCEGWMSGFTRCLFKAKPEDVNRYKFKIPDEYQNSLKWVDKWLIKHGIEVDADVDVDANTETKESKESKKEEKEEEEEKEVKEEEKKGREKGGESGRNCHC